MFKKKASMHPHLLLFASIILQMMINFQHLLLCKMNQVINDNFNLKEAKHVCNLS